jgi:LysM repeat protein
MHYFSLDRQYKFILNLMESKKQTPPKRKLGYVSQQYESNQGIGTISRGTGDKGGVSYGTHQFASAVGTPKDFVSYIKQNEPEDSPLRSLIGLTDFGDYNGAFANQWRNLSKSHADLLSKAAQTFTDVRYYEEPLKNLKKKDSELGKLVETNEGLNELFYSTNVQHGQSGGPRIFLDARARCPDGKKNCPFAITKNVFEIRRDKILASGNSQEIKNAVTQSRYPEEEKAVTALLKTARTTQTPPQTPPQTENVPEPQVGSGTYKIQPGDSLSVIAQKVSKERGFKITEDDLAKLNEIPDKHTIRAGRELKIPENPNAQKQTATAQAAPKPELPAKQEPKETKTPEDIVTMSKQELADMMKQAEDKAVQNAFDVDTQAKEARESKKSTGMIDKVRAERERLEAEKKKAQENKTKGK